MQAKRGTIGGKRKSSRPAARTTTKQRQQRRKNNRRIIMLIAIGGVVCLLLYAFNLEQLRIGSFAIDGNSLLQTKEIQQDLDSYFDGKYYGIFPKDSIFWYGKDQLKKYVTDNYAEIDTVEISLKKFDVLEISITERKQVYNVVIDEQLYDLDAAGVIFRESDQQTSPERVFSLGLNQETKKIGDSLVDAEYFVQFNKFIDNLRQKGVVVNKILFENKILTILELTDGSRLVLHPADSFDTTLQTLDEILLYKEFSYNRKDEQFTSDVAYINLRYGSKLFYCYTTDVCASNYVIK